MLILPPRAVYAVKRVVAKVVKINKVLKKAAGGVQQQALGISRVSLFF